MIYVQVKERTGHTVKLAAGAAQGLMTGSVWTVYREGTQDAATETPPLARE